MSKKSKPTQKPKVRKDPIDQQRQAATKLQQKPTIQHTNQQKENATRRKSTNQRDIAIREEEEEETIKISSDEEETTTTAVTVKTAPDESVGRDPPTFGKSSRARNCSPPHSCSSSSGLSSPISSSYRSLDYEAEADEEDANECESIVELQRKLVGGNTNLMHVQNFLNYFDEQQQKPKSTAIFGGANAQSQKDSILQQLELHNTTQYQMLVGGDTEINRLTNYVAQHAVDGLMTLQQAEANGIPNTATHTAIAISTTTAAIATSASNVKTTTNKPCKFTISTKFLRKPRHKLKSVNLRPSAEAKNVLVTTPTTVDKDKLMTMPEQQNQQQAHVLLQMQQQQQQQQKQQPRQQPPADEPNVKFNSNFSINSLLNKK